MSEKLHYILENYGTALSETILERTKTRISPEIALETFREADPSRNAGAVQWLVRIYLNGGFRFEDITGGSDSKVADTLRLFSAYVKNLPENNRSLTGYKTLAELYESVSSYVKAEQERTERELLAHASGRRKRRLEREKARRESIIIREDNRATIAVPLTEFASCWWGRGTRWCTAADEENAFHAYNEYSPLVVIVMSDGHKFQLYAGDEHQFMDSSDRDVTDETASVYADVFLPVMEWAMELNPYTLSRVPPDMRTSDMYLRVAENSGMALEIVPEAEKTKEICDAAMRKDGCAMAYVPGCFLDTEICTEAVRSGHYALRYVPDHMINEEMCMIAVKNSGNCLCYVPERFRSYNLHMAALGNTGNALNHINPEQMDNLMRLTAVKNYGRVLKNIPSELRTVELCDYAVENDGHALKYVPAELKTREMCIKAVSDAGRAVRYVPPEFISDNIYSLAVTQNPEALGFVPVANRTYSMCLEAIKKKPFLIRKVPENIADVHLWNEAVKRDGSMLCESPEHFRTSETCMNAVKSEWCAVDSVPSEILTAEMCEEAVRLNIRAMKFIPLKFQTEKLLNMEKGTPPVRWNREILEKLRIIIEHYPDLNNQAPVMDFAPGL